MSPESNFATSNGTAPPMQHNMTNGLPNGDYRPAMQQAPMATPLQYSQNAQQHAPALDPNLFAYQDQPGNGGYVDNTYNYAAPQRPQMYQYESLEQIASQVLDMNGHSNEDPHHDPHAQEAPHMPNGGDEKFDASNADGSVDSGISLPGSDSDRKEDQGINESAHEPPATENGLSETHPSLETSSHPAVQSKDPSVTSLPLYRPPAPLSQSPELSRRQPVLPDVVEKDGPPSGQDETEEEKTDRELAVALQQEGLGLRRR
jgi:F-box/leucine-rich repeat protein 10/11